MSSGALRLPEDSLVAQLATAIAQAGGRLIIVGGWVRDALRGVASRDLDVEVFGLSDREIARQIEPFGFTSQVGAQFPVWRHTRAHIDLASPRARTTAADTGERSSQPPLTQPVLERVFREASRHRDLTFNAIGWDPMGQHLLDPWHGRDDLAAKRLRAVDLETFGRDPLRLLRVARLASLLEGEVDAALGARCRSLDLSAVPVERIASELRRMLCEPLRPSRGFEFLAGIDRLDVCAPVEALRGVPQDPRWHPEGDVFVHTMSVIDRAREISGSLPLPALEIQMWAALGHDFGKPETTEAQTGRIRAIGHEGLGAERVRDWLASLRIAQRTVRAVELLVRHHLAPAQFVAQGAGPRAYRRLARKLAAGGLTVVDLERLARADHLGRTTPDARAGRFDAGPLFLAAAEQAEVREGVREDLVKASHLMQRGIEPGPELGRLIARSREIQDETGWHDVDRILDRVLGSAGAPDTH